MASRRMCLKSRFRLVLCASVLLISPSTFDSVGGNGRGFETPWGTRVIALCVKTYGEETGTGVVKSAS